MGKIRVKDLAVKMGLDDQDLLFKLRSIGVRVDDERSEIDSDVLSAILQGKKLAPPREVILRDETARDKARRAPSRRPALSPLRPRPRTLIQRVEPRIRTIPTVERPPEPDVTPAATAPPPSEEAATSEVQAAVEAAPAAPPAAVEPQRPAEVVPKPVKVREHKVEPERVDPRRPRPRPVDTAAEDAARSRRRRSRAEAKPATPDALTFQGERPDGPITIVEGMTVREFADKLQVKTKDLIKQLVQRGILANINSVLDSELALKLAESFGLEGMIVTFEEEVQLQQESEQEADSAGTQPRPPVVTIMGHVDHGKTTLLDRIRESRIAEGESGGITQHIGAYLVELAGKRLAFIDTPGHEAFTMLRARGAQVTDIVVLVVAADDGVMPQTVEAINHARAAKVPIVVALNKMDKSNANPDKVKKELADHNLVPEDWGGDTVVVPMSAKDGKGIPELLELLLLTADLQELKANPDLPAQGVLLEARKDIGRGTVATILIQNGTLHIGDIFVSGATWGRVRSMTSDLGKRLKETGPATPVEVTGFSEVPEAGDPFQVVDEESKARTIADFRRQEARTRDLVPSQTKVSLEQLFDRIEKGETKELPIVIKADVQGSVEVLRETVEKLSTDRVKVRVLHAAIGAITTYDVLLASASDAIIVGFNVRPERNAVELADREQVEIRLHTVIYELGDELKKAMVGLLEPTFKEVAKGRAEVREIFKIPRIGTIGGCHVVEGVVPRTAMVRLLRDNVVVYEGKLSSLKRFKDDAAEVRTGFDCGIGLDRFQDLKPGDIIEAYAREEVAPTL